jgi:hypothetical protein
MPKQDDECPICGYDLDEEGCTRICRHCGIYYSNKIKGKSKSIHNIRHFNPSSRDDLDVRPKI